MAQEQYHRQVISGSLVSSGLASLTLARDPENPYAPHYELIYGASKTAMNAVTVAFANELEKSGIRVSAVSPGFTGNSAEQFSGNRFPGGGFEGTDTRGPGRRRPDGPFYRPWSGGLPLVKVNCFEKKDLWRIHRHRFCFSCSGPDGFSS